MDPSCNTINPDVTVAALINTYSPSCSVWHDANIKQESSETELETDEIEQQIVTRESGCDVSDIQQEAKNDYEFSIKLESLNEELDLKAETVNYNEDYLLIDPLTPSQMECNMQQSITTHAGENSNESLTSAQTFNGEKQLNNYTKIQTDEKSLSCTVCNYSCTTKLNLQQHMQKYTGKNFFKCNACDYASAQKINLQRHMSTHSGEKPFKTNRVHKLLKIKFSRLAIEEKLEIKRLGRPTPNLNLTQTMERKAQNRCYTYRFSAETYKKNNWLCGCDVLNLLFCFPCLLFYKDPTGLDEHWARTGMKDLHHLKEKIAKHEISKHHINAFASYTLLGKANIAAQFSSTYRESVAKHNETVRKKRHVLKRIISCIRFCSAFETALRGHDESEDSLNRGIFRELVDFAAELDSALKEHLNSATVFAGTSKTIQNEILDCILEVCREEISDQIGKSDFLAIQCDETTDVSNQCQMVLIFRYVYTGRVYERFWGFFQIKDKTAEGLKNSILQEIDPLISQTPQKLISQTYDGANVTIGETGDVQAKIKQKYPCAYFVHCYAHQLNLFMQKAASQNSRVRVFFQNLSAIPAFFSNSSHRCDILQEIMKRRLPKVAITCWNYDIRLVNIVYENQDALIGAFEEIENKQLKGATTHEAYGLRRALEDPEFMFWLKFFHNILPHVDMLYNQLQSRNRDSVQIQEDISVFEESISLMRARTDDIQEEVDSNFIQVKRKRLDHEDRRSVIAKEVCDTILVQMKERFAFRGHLEAAALLNNSSFSEFYKNFPVDILHRVVSFYPMLSKKRLKSELEVIYTRSDFKEISGAMNILTFLLKNNLEAIFIETLRLLNIIVTTPMTTAEADRCFSTLKRVKSFLRNTMLNDRLNALATMSINRSLVNEIDNFEEKVAEKFISMKNRRAEFHFKN